MSLEDAIFKCVGLSNGKWPLYVETENLQLVFRILLKRQLQLESTEDNEVVLDIWKGVLETFRVEYERDNFHQCEGNPMNLEHTQMLLLLFHLSLTQETRCSLLNDCLELVQCVGQKAGQSDLSVSLLSSLLLLTEYMLRHLDTMPDALQRNVEANLFAPSLDSMRHYETSQVVHCYVRSTQFDEECAAMDEKLSLQPSKFYEVCSTTDRDVISSAALRFIESMDAETYAAMFDGFLQILNVTDATSSSLTYGYFLTICWRFVSI